MESAKSVWEEKEVAYSQAPPPIIYVSRKLQLPGRYNYKFGSITAKQKYLKNCTVVVITHGLMYEIPNASFSSALLYANFLELLNMPDRQGLSLPRCLKLCQLAKPFLYNEDKLFEYKVQPEKLKEEFRAQKPEKGNGMEMPDVEVVKVFEDIKVLNEVFKSLGSTAPTKFDMVKESLKSGEVLVQMNSEEFIITDHNNDELISTEKSFSKEEFNEKAAAACFADDHHEIIFQDFSMKSDSDPSKADLIVQVLKEKEKPVMVGMRIKDFLHCVLIVDSDSNKKELYAKSWEEDQKGFVLFTFDDFNENAIEAYFFDNKCSSFKIKDSLIDYGNTRETIGEKKYHDSMIFKKNDGLGYEFRPGNSLQFPELVLNSDFEVSELELTENEEKNITTGAGFGYPSGLQLNGGLNMTSGGTRKIVYKRNDDPNKKPILVSYAQNANERNPCDFRLWGLRVTNKAQDTLLIPKLSALSIYFKVGKDIIEKKFKKRNFLIKCHKRLFSNKKEELFITNKNALETIACYSGEVTKDGDKLEIRSNEFILFPEWPAIEKSEGFLCCLQFEADAAKKLYCGVVRAKSKEAEEALILEFSKLV